jgi:hypothetical protein
MLGALRVIGCDEVEAWRIVRRCALDSMPAGRRRVLNHLAGGGTASTGVIGNAVGLPTQTTRRHLEDLECHGVVDRYQQGEGKADLWEMSAWAAGRWTVPETSGSMEPTNCAPHRPHLTNKSPEMRGELFGNGPLDAATTTTHSYIPCSECGEAMLLAPGRRRPCALTPGCKGQHAAPNAVA